MCSSVRVWASLAVGRDLHPCPGGGKCKTYATDDPPAPPTIADQIPRTSRHFTRDEMSGFAKYVPFPAQLLAFEGTGVTELVFAAECLLHEAIAVLQDVSADLAACA